METCLIAIGWMGVDVEVGRAGSCCCPLQRARQRIDSCLDTLAQRRRLSPRSFPALLTIRIFSLFFFPPPPVLVESFGLAFGLGFWVGCSGSRVWLVRVGWVGAGWSGKAGNVYRNCGILKQDSFRFFASKGGKSRVQLEHDESN